MKQKTRSIDIEREEKERVTRDREANLTSHDNYEEKAVCERDLQEVEDECGGDIGKKEDYKFVAEGIKQREWNVCEEYINI